MENEIKDIVDKIALNTNKDEAIFIIKEYGGAPDGSFIEANKEGLLLFAAELLNAYLEKENIQRTYKNKIDIGGPNDLFQRGSTVIDYVEYLNINKEHYKNNSFQAPSTWRQKAANYIRVFFGFIFVILIIIVLSAGLETTFKWFFK